VSRYLVLALLVAAPSREACALGSLTTRGPEERALGMDREAYSLVFTPDAGHEAGLWWRFDAGEWTLFEVDGLAVGSCAAEARCPAWGVILSADLLSSPVGREAVLGGALLFAGATRAGLAGGLRLETLALDGCEREFLLSFSVDAVVRVVPRMVMCSRVNAVRLAGTSRAGADVSLRVVAFPEGTLCAIAGIAVTRNGDVVCDVSSRVRLARRVRAVLGYDDGTAAINGALSIGVRAFALEAGASVHPVLGVSKSLFLSWRFGPWNE
jgi:hypothetical protein